MLVNLEEFGRIGNRLFLDAHLTAFGWKYDFLVRNLALDSLVTNLPAIEGPSPGFSRWLWQVAGRLPGSRHFRYWGDRNLDFDEDNVSELIEPLVRGRTVFFHAWKFRGFRSVARFRDRIVARYRPTATIADGVSRLIAGARDEGDIVVGVHIRWEDYRGTDYFLSVSEYCHQMNRVAALLAPRRPIFLVFSNETIPREPFAGLSALFPSGNPWEDLYTMASCDYLLGPPSTFSGWASFYGAVPLLTLTRGTPVDANGFRMVQG
jgi:hypothetical protein